MLQDIRYALRNLARSPGFTAVALASMALGIGANTAIFSITDQVLLRLLPVRHARELLYFTTGGSNQGMIVANNAFSYPMYRDLAARTDLFAAVGARFATPASLAWSGRSDRVTAEIVTGNYFDTLGLGVALGRGIAPDDDRIPGAHNVVVLTHRFWRSRFGANPAILNQTVTLNAHPMTVIGVAAPHYDGYASGERCDVLVPVMMKAQMTPTWNGLEDRRTMWLQLVGRLQSGVQAGQAEAVMRTYYRSILLEELKQISEPSPRLRKGFETKPFALTPGMSGSAELRDDLSAPLLLLSGMVGLLLLIACANVANLLLARASGRRKEIAVRLAVGASRWRLVRQLVVESVVISLLGGALGLLLAAWTGWWMARFLPDDTSIVFDAPVDPRTLAFTAALAVLTGLIFGLAPALQATHPQLAGVLKDQSGTVSPGRGQIRLRQVLVITQVVLSLVLLIGATLFARSLYNLRGVDLGFRSERLVVFSLEPALNGYSTDRLKTFAHDLQERLGTIPGVRSAAVGESLLFDNNRNQSTIFIVGYQPKDGENMNPFIDAVSAGYFSTLGQPLLFGREFSGRDLAGSPPVAIVNETFTRRFFPNQSPLGRRIGMRRDRKTTFEIVGVVKDSRVGSVREKPPIMVYLPLQQQEDPTFLGVFALAAGDTGRLFPAIRQEVARMDPALPIASLRTMDAQVDVALAGERLIAVLATAFGLLAAALSAVGLYGVMAYTVSRRTREFGIRVALGVARGDLLSMVLREVAVLTLAGMAIAIPSAIALARLAQSLLFGVEPADTLSVAAAAMALSGVALLAGWFPARRAARVDPLRALRYE